jgi:hypothetical protein
LSAFRASALVLILASAMVRTTLTAQSPGPGSPPRSEPASAPIPTSVGAIPTGAGRSSGLRYRRPEPSALNPAAIRVEAAESLDLAIARALRGTDLQESGTARAVAGVFRLASLPGTLLLAGTLYGIGEIDNRQDLSDLGLQTGQAILGAGAVTLVGKLAAGRARPRISPEDASDFGLGRGFRGNDYQAFPSAHTASAFAAGTVLAMDIAARHPGSAVWVYPSVYAAATMAGLSRLFDEEHWATDIVGGALIGIVGGIAVSSVHGGPTSQ